VVLDGGQEDMNATTTAAQAGIFVARFSYIVFE